MDVIQRWHNTLHSDNSEGLYDLLDPDCTFWSPVVHTPQRGREITFAYLSAAQKVFSQDFSYLREVRQGNHCVLEFRCVMDDIEINGVDMIEVRDDVIVEFKVMVRPLQAVNKVHEQMMAMLERLRG